MKYSKSTLHVNYYELWIIKFHYKIEFKFKIEFFF